MIRPVLLLTLLSSAALSVPRFSVAADPDQRYLEAYFLIESGDDAETAGEWPRAQAKYTAALKILDEIKADNADWRPSLLEFRIRYCRTHLAAAKSMIAAAPAAPVTPPAPAPVAVVAPTPSGEAEQIRQLQTALQKSREEVRKLEEIRDHLTSRLEEKLKEPAPSDRATAQQTLEQLRGLQAVHEAVTAKLETAKEKAARADQLEAELQQSQEKIRDLETERTGLNTKLQDALGKLSAAQTSPQVEDLMKKNADLTAQLASAQAEITKMHDELTATGKTVPAADSAELVKLRADNSRLEQAQEELMARLNESERQLRAAKVSTEKDNEIIQQLRNENALLREIASKKNAETTAKPKRGFLWFKPRETRPAATAGPAVPPASAVSQSETGKLTAAVKAPTPPETTREPAPSSAPSAESPLIRGLLDEARAAVDQHDLATAASKFQAVLDQEPNNMTALSNLGVIYYKLNRLDEAEEILRKSVSATPNDSQARSVLGVVCFRKGKTDDAYNELTRAVALNPRNAEAHNYLGIVMSEKGWPSAAEQEVRRAIELNEQYADAHFNLAVIYSRLKTPRLELARHHYQRARDLGADRDPQLEAVLGNDASPAKP